MIGLCAVPLPPVVKSWTQDFQWSMGLINVGFIEAIVTWYQRATGGTASTIFGTLQTVSVQVEKVKRALPAVGSALGLFQRSAPMLPAPTRGQLGGLAKRGYTQTSYGSYIVYGIQRAGFRAGIETTNIFLTGLTFFYLFMLLAIIAVALFKGVCELAVRMRLMKGDTFSEFRAGWLTVLKGIHAWPVGGSLWFPRSADTG